MSGVFVNLGTDLELMASQMASYYGAGITVHVTTSSNFIFSCPAISSKDIRIYIASSQVLAQWGDYVSGTTLTSPVFFGGSGTTGSMDNMIIVMKSDLFYLFWTASIVTARHLIIGELTDGSSGVLGASAHASYTAGSHSHILPSSTPYMHISLAGDGKFADGGMLKMPYYFANLTGDVPYHNDLPVSFKSIFNCTRRLPNDAYFLGEDYFITPGGMTADVGLVNYNSLVIEDVVVPE